MGGRGDKGGRREHGKAAEHFLSKAHRYVLKARYNGM
jgi:hypothetical protein